jgi:DNA mismatch endonuclease (patch repair protein)
MMATKRRDTPCELAIRSAVHHKGFRYRVDWLLPGTRRRGDLVFVRSKVVVFVDGCFWHGCPLHGSWPKANAAWWRTKIEANIARDRDSDRRLRKSNWRVLRFWEHDDPVVAVQRIVTALRKASR